jgi:protein gp37
MSANSAISWTDHTFSPWWGCCEASLGCTHCYAKAWAHRLGRDGLWGKDGHRRVAGPKTWTDPFAWNRKAREAGVKAKVFCASMADVCEDRPDLIEPRARLEALIQETESLVWILCTKRPENYGLFSTETLRRCWLLATAENQAMLDCRVPDLFSYQAACRGVSLEPLLGPVDVDRYVFNREQAIRGAMRGPAALNWDQADAIIHESLDWVIVGPETGPKRRPCDIAWIRSVVQQCRDAHVPAHVKALEVEGIISHNPREWPQDLRVRDEVPR